MAVTRSKAYEVLGLDQGATHEQIRSAYKKLALQWHPDKHSNSQESTRKFQEISSAYKRLTTEDEKDEIELSFEDMFDLFTQLFFGGGYIPDHYFDESESDSEEYCFVHRTYHQSIPTVRPSTQTNHHAGTPSFATKKPVKSTNYNTFSYEAYTRSFEEARTNADALIEEEEREKQVQEKKRERKRRKKQKKREEKENKARVQNSNRERLASESSNDSDGEEAARPKAGGDQFKSNNSSSVLQPSSSSERTMPNKKSDPTDKKSTVGGKKNDVSQNDVANNKNSKNNKKKTKKEISSGDDEATQGLDLNSAFCKSSVTSYNKKVSSQKKNKKGKEDPNLVESAESKTQRSRKLAIRGNDLATRGDYTGAIELFSQAISLDPNDHRFFGNRSYCFDQTNQHDKALKDATRAISLSSDWPKGYFRKGRALAGLKSFIEAERAYEQVLKLDPGCEEATVELKRVRVLQLMDMGFERVQSEVAIVKWVTVEAATDALLSGKLDAQVLEGLEEVYISDDEDVLSQTIQNAKTDVRNPEKLRSIWIGNLSQSASEKQLRELFGRFGVVESMRRLPEKYCAFINYRDASMATEAMKCLQGFCFYDKELLIKFPDHPISDGHPNNGTIYLKKTKSSTATNNNQANYSTNTQQPKPAAPRMQQMGGQPQQGGQQQYSGQEAMRGPVNGNECYFWRTTGCWYGDTCKYLHLPECKGADRKSWHKGAGPV